MRVRAQGKRWMPYGIPHDRVGNATRSETVGSRTIWLYIECFRSRTVAFKSGYGSSAYTTHFDDEGSRALVVALESSYCDGYSPIYI